MQHYGAPTRLLDWTYSPFVAAMFALENGAPEDRECDPVVWCVNTKWCEETAMKNAGRMRIRSRNIDTRRNEASFLRLYMSDSDSNPKKCRCKTLKFVCTENPLPMNERLTAQQGLFLCPGDISSSFEANLQAMEGYREPRNLVKLRFRLIPYYLREFADRLRRMNVASETLFPGLGGLAKSLGERACFYRRQAQRNTGKDNYKI
jgi:hypothetical protein